jgi:hypothetical protein
MAKRTPGKRVVPGRNLLSKAKAVSAAEGQYIIDHATGSTSKWAVLQHKDQWFDVRGMTQKEISRLIDDLDRAWNEELVAGILLPH